jgi:hypothetical protein
MCFPHAIKLLSANAESLLQNVRAEIVIAPISALH